MIIKFNELLANCVVYHTTRDITDVVAELTREGWEVNPHDLATISRT